MAYRQITIPPSLDGARLARESLGRILRELGQPEESLRPALLAISEMIVNIVRHASPAASQITLGLDIGSESYCLEILDNGGPFYDFKKYFRSCSAATGLKENGMGLSLVQASFPNGRYEPSDQRTDGLNRFLVSIPLEKKRPHVLLVDDDLAQLALISAMLRTDYIITAVDSAETALAEIAQKSFDLIISDIVMPGMSGIDFRRQLAVERETDIIPFLFLSSQDEVRILRENGALAIDAYLTKPVEKLRLLSALKRALRRSQQMRQRLGERFDDAITNLLRPSLPAQLNAWRAELRFRPASAGGGDMVFHSLDSTGAWIVIADLMGHGERAKFFSHALMGYLYGLLQAHIHTEDPSPAYLMGQLSSAFADAPLLKDTLATAQILRLTPDGDVRIANAGHPSPIHIAKDGRALSLDCGGLLLGIAPDRPYKETVLHLDINERLALYTDGLFDPSQSASLINRPALSLTEALHKSAHHTLNDAVTVIMEAFDAAPPEPADDALLILLERSPEGNAASKLAAH